MVQTLLTWGWIATMVLAGVAYPAQATAYDDLPEACPEIVTGVEDPRCCEVDGPDGECGFACIAHGVEGDPDVYEPFGVYVQGRGFMVTVQASCGVTVVAQCSTPPDPCQASGESRQGEGTCRVSGFGTGVCLSALKPLPI